MSDAHDQVGCLICGSRVNARGLCSKHSTDFHRIKKGLPPDKREEFDQQCVREGKILPSRAEGKRVDTEFDEIASRVMESSTDYETGRESSSGGGSQVVLTADQFEALRQLFDQARVAAPAGQAADDPPSDPSDKRTAKQKAAAMEKARKAVAARKNWDGNPDTFEPLENTPETVQVLAEEARAVKEMLKQQAKSIEKKSTEKSE